MSDLAEFLLARITEDEAVARNSAADFGEDGRRATWTEVSSGVLDTGDECWPIGDSAISRHAEHFDPARVLAECEAKRRIIAKAQRADRAFGQSINPASSAASFALTEVLGSLAAPYRDHPDYDPAW